MSCIMTVLTIMSVFNGSQWNDVSVSTNSKIVVGMNEQVSAKAELILDNVMKTETTTVKCGEDVYAVTTSTLTVEE